MLNARKRLAEVPEETDKSNHAEDSAANLNCKKTLADICRQVIENEGLYLQSTRVTPGADREHR